MDDQQKKVNEAKANKKLLDFIVKDSGVREEYPSGMRRDTQEGKPDYTLIHIPFLTRLAIHLGKGAEKYGEHNWMLANSGAELKRFKSSAFRHLLQWLSGLVDEDHAMATVFNIMAAEFVKDKLKLEEENDRFWTVFFKDGSMSVTTELELESLRFPIQDQILYAIPGVHAVYKFDGSTFKIKDIRDND